MFVLNKDYPKLQASSAIKGFDVVHQIFRLRYTKNMLDSEAFAITKSLADGVKTYDQVIEVCYSLHSNDGLKLVSAACFIATWRGLIVPGFFPLSSKRSYSRFHGAIVQSATWLPCV